MFVEKTIFYLLNIDYYYLSLSSDINIAQMLLCFVLAQWL